MTSDWLIKAAAVVVFATIPISLFNVIYYDNPIWFIPAAVAFAILYAG